MCDPTTSKSAEAAVYCALLVAISLFTGTCAEKLDAEVEVTVTLVYEAGVLTVANETGLFTVVEESGVLTVVKETGVLEEIDTGVQATVVWVDKIGLAEIVIGVEIETWLQAAATVSLEPLFDMNSE